MIIYSSTGISLLLKFLKKPFQIIILGLIVIVGISSTYEFISNPPNLITPEEFETIERISQMTPTNSSIIFADSYYAPWLIGWSNREVLGEGILSYKNTNIHKELINGGIINTSNPTYIYLGRIGDENAFFNNLEKHPCIKVVYKNYFSKLLEYQNKC